MRDEGRAATQEQRYRAVLRERGIPVDLPPAALEARIDADVTDLDSAKELLKRLAVSVAALQNRVYDR